MSFASRRRESDGPALTLTMLSIALYILRFSSPLHVQAFSFQRSIHGLSYVHEYGHVSLNPRVSFALLASESDSNPNRSEGDERYAESEAESLTRRVQNTPTHQNIQDASRRNVITQSPAVVASIMAILQMQDSPANAEVDLLDQDPKKVVMQLSNQNIPKKNYQTTSSTSTATTTMDDMDFAAMDGRRIERDRFDEMDGLTESEIRRIAVFEKAAPSVVYIDTYQEQRDAFSTNTMEVAVGTGSGFVWDDKGHIVTNCKFCVSE